jgi:hypothetical protein
MKINGVSIEITVGIPVTGEKIMIKTNYERRLFLIPRIF